MGDFLGFTFGGVHSSDLGITRVSGGDRYDEQLHPEIKDRTAEVPGVNGNYYFGSDFGPRTIDIEIAYDHLTEKQLRDLRRVFGTKEIKELIFDEHPYKKYMAKLESPVELSYICFNERIRVKYSEEHSIGTIDTQEGAISGETLEELPDGVRMEYDDEGNRVRQKVDPWVYKEGTERIYKGEGKMTFICYFPFAKSTFKVLPEAGEKYYEGSEEWAISSGILNSTQYANVDKYNNGSITVYNPGDIVTGFRLYLPAAALNSATTLTYRLDNNHPISTLVLKAMSLKSGDLGVLVDTNNGLITGVSVAPTLDPSSGEYNYTTSGNLYNQYVDSGYFFHLEPNKLYVYSTLQITGGANGIRIFYDYLYF